MKKNSVIKVSMWRKVLCLLCMVSLPLLLCSCNSKSEKSKEQAGSPNENPVSAEQTISIGTFTFEEVEDAIPAGCTCWLSFNKKENEQDKYIYADDFGTVAVMKINGEIVVFEFDRKKGPINIEDTMTAKSANYTLEITKKYVDDTGYESGAYEGIIKLTDKEGKSIQQECWGTCGC